MQNGFIHHETVNMSSYHGSWKVPTRTNSVQNPMVLNNTKPGAVNINSYDSSGMLSTRTPLVQNPVVPKLHKCDKCDKRFTGRCGLRTHMQLVHKAHVCIVCGQTFPKKYYLEQHCMKHAAEKLVQRPVADPGFPVGGAPTS